MRPLRVAFLPLLPSSSAATRAFCARPLPHLRALGIEPRLLAPSGNRSYRLLQRPAGPLRAPLSALYWYGVVAPRRAVQLPRALRADVVFVQRSAFRIDSRPLPERLLRAAGRRLVVHCDDALFAARTPERWRARFRAADWVVTGSDAVEEFARAAGARVWRYDAPVDVDRYPLREHRPRDGVTIGWVGQFPEAFLAPVAPALARVVAARPGVRIRVVADKPLAAPALGAALEWERWTLEREFACFDGLDVGIMPLPDTPYARGKEAFKLKEYMAAGLPVVCSPVGANAALVEDGATGFHARGEDEWVERLLRLVDDAELRARLGGAGRRLVEERFALERRARELGEFLLAVGRDEAPVPLPALVREVV